MGSGRFLLAGLLLLGWSLAREGRTALRSAGSSSATRSSLGALLLGGGMGMVALGEQTVPAGITALLIALMPLWVAVLGRIVFGERTSRLVLARHRHRPRRRRHPRRPDGHRRPGPLGRRHRRGPGVADQLGPGSLYSSHRARLPHLPLVATAMQMFCGAVVLGALSLVTGELSALLAGRGDRPFLARLRVPGHGRQRHRLHDIRLDAPGRAAAQDRHVRVRQPDRRVRPQRDRAGREPSPRGRSWRRRHRRRRSPSSSRPAAGRRPAPDTVATIEAGEPAPERTRGARHREPGGGDRPSDGARQPSRSGPAPRRRRSSPPRSRPLPSGPRAGRGP